MLLIFNAREVNRFVGENDITVYSVSTTNKCKHLSTLIEPHMYKAPIEPENKTYARAGKSSNFTWAEPPL